MSFGSFDYTTHEYVITHPASVPSWINILANERYTAVISPSGDGYSHAGHESYQHLKNHPFPSRSVYIHEIESGVVWSLFPQTSQKSGEYQTRVGQGYTSITCQKNHTESITQFFVPQDELCECWSTTLINKAARKRTFRVYVLANIAPSVHYLPQALYITWHKNLSKRQI